MPLTRDQVRSQLMPPAIVLLILAILTILLNLYGLIFNMVMLVDWERGLLENYNFLVGNLAIVLMNIGILFGAVAMLRMRSWRSARVAAILAIIPICGPCFVIGIPFGIWALRILNRPGTREAFWS